MNILDVSCPNYMIDVSKYILCQLRHLGNNECVGYCTLFFNYDNLSIFIFTVNV